jgi:hypothetical protein
MEVQKIALQRALRFLIAAKCQFCVIEEDGTQHGELVVQKLPAYTKKPGLFPRGTLHAHFYPYLKDLPEGEMALVPYGRFDAAEARSALRKSITSWASANWGNQSYITSMAESGIEVLRA